MDILEQQFGYSRDALQEMLELHEGNLEVALDMLAQLEAEKDGQLPASGQVKPDAQELCSIWGEYVKPSVEFSHVDRKPFSYPLLQVSLTSLSHAYLFLLRVKATHTISSAKPSFQPRMQHACSRALNM